MNNNKNQLSSEQQKELLKTLKARFEKNTNRHKGLEWINVQTRLEANPESFGHSTKWNYPEVNRMLSIMIKRRVSLFL
jgi:hypothetical protein